MKARHCLNTIKYTLLAAMCLLSIAAAAEQVFRSPNILWISIDDQSPWYSSYGDKLVNTPNIDALAKEGVLFERAYAAAPVCSPSRSALITGGYPIRLGTHDHRSGRVPEYQIHLPDDVRPLPVIFREAGYETYNGSKDDFNFTYRRSELYSIGSIENPVVARAVKGQRPALERGDQSWKGSDGAGDWRDVPEGKIFFGQMSVSGGKGVGKIVEQLKSLGIKPVDPADVRVPPQYPDTALVRQHIATHYNSLLRTDYEIGKTVERLKADGLWQNTVIFLYSDHGSDLPRSKEFCYDEGLHVPLIVVAPGMTDIVKPGTRRHDIVNLMDVSATSLALASLPIPAYMDVRNLFAPDYSRQYVFSSADRMSNVIDRVRSVMGSHYHYIRNFMTDRPLMNWGHREMISLYYYPTMTSFLEIRRLAEEGKLTPAQAAPYGPRVPEELYDLQNDPDEVVNLAGDPAHRDTLATMRTALDGWIRDTDDKGQYPRSQAAMDEIINRYPVSWLRSPEFKDVDGVNMEGWPHIK